MIKKKPNEVVYHVLSNHINHYRQGKKIFKTDYDSHMITITVFTHFLCGTLNPSHEPKKTMKLIFKMFKKEKCLKRGVTIGGMHGDEYLPQFINFFKENLL